ncbi:Similar to hypothetical protein GLRG_11185 [Glomerella graminicola M1.001]; acc. no. EFQ36041 [Pyronema omphalodes CBS 100304]|uniref:Uncharacterized protein n=1 Tax=Pyronema omphalodes (strain CBS 100304) TaxID=1076935 RepID=U4L2T4_PYROM|nr:Similar to hypothetical protein GLRG_11185 [Glomerella graminicola M1.001]; acc. no. EFQ36041 [Pyronema omphalodes CBS 100304]
MSSISGGWSSKSEADSNQISDENARPVKAAELQTGNGSVISANAATPTTSASSTLVPDTSPAVFTPLFLGSSQPSSLFAPQSNVPQSTPAFQISNGSTAAPTSQSTASLFGSTSGNTVTTLQPATSIFGSTSTPKPAASLFGNVAVPASSTTQPTTSLFSSTPAPGLFGSSSLFGSTPAPGIFGSAPAPASSTTQPASMFFCGAAITQPVTPSLFGSTGTSRPLFPPVLEGSTPLFGSPSSSTTASTADAKKSSPLILSNPRTTLIATSKKRVPQIPAGSNAKITAGLYAPSDEELSDDDLEEMPSLDEQMCLLSMDTVEGEESELANTDVKNAVMFTADVLKKTKHRKLLPQYKSCLLPTRTLGLLNRPLSAMVFHFSAYTSKHAFRPCEAAFLAVPNPHFNIKPVPVTILVPPSNYLALKAAYGQIPNVKVYPLRLRPEDLNINAMLTLMSVNSNNSNPPLYMSTVTKILRDMAAKSTVFDFKQFRRELVNADFDDRQMKPLEQRLDLLESFLVTDGKKDKGGFEFKEGSITIVDLSCPFVDENTACVLFNICLGVYLQDNNSVAGKVVAVDEAHKYITKSPASKVLTESLLALIRQQRHYGARIIISTQEPTVDPRLMDLCSATLVHRFTSPVWFSVLKKHISVIEDESKDAALFRKMVDLRVGQGLLFASSAVINKETAVDLSVEVEKKKDESGDEREDASSEVQVENEGVLEKLGSRFLKIKIRKRLTADGGKSIVSV